MMRIELRHIHKSFGSKVLFDDFSYVFEEGKIYAVTGDSGTGKTTLLNMIGFLEKVDRGEIIIDGNNHWSSKKIRELYKHKLSFLFQNYALIDNYTVEKNLQLILDKNDDKRIDDLLNLLHIKDLKKQRIYTLSGGQQQRVALARALLHNTDIMLCDEPTGNLDEHNRDIIITILKEWMNENKIIIMVTHDLELAKQCDIQIDLNTFFQV
ncbi:ATP-binding cassette domain-containing protein [Sharpea azabuensis]|uniref:ATP-binding cassette domain-containing protein n=1 Tax=Sharpea porci TaxID=2652286 RepID=A0A844FW19_9FIRM|nr:ATP-binding cassette domain-containing protein [Sharpea porci]MDD6712597.1 ATP-binding cassette domain-containing protein [Sharpea porci]MDY5278820.1 ATP-binding cassette domain-containing protein [Sharpea porci]MST89823.1 ATP-binding cassette domain-containing protein [Sharpea porci]